MLTILINILLTIVLNDFCNCKFLLLQITISICETCYLNASSKEKHIDENKLFQTLMENSTVRTSKSQRNISKKFCLFSGIGGVFDRVLITYPNDKPLLSSRINNVSRF